MLRRGRYGGRALRPRCGGGTSGSPGLFCRRQPGRTRCLARATRASSLRSSTLEPAAPAPAPAPAASTARRRGEPAGAGGRPAQPLARQGTPGGGTVVADRARSPPPGTPVGSPPEFSPARGALQRVVGGNGSFARLRTRRGAPYLIFHAPTNGVSETLQTEAINFDHAWLPFGSVDAYSSRSALSKVFSHADAAGSSVKASLYWPCDP